MHRALTAVLVEEAAQMGTVRRRAVEAAFELKEADFRVWGGPKASDTGPLFPSENPAGSTP